MRVSRLALRVTAIRPALGRVRGSALDTSGVRRVQVALRGRRTKAGCRWWVPSRKRMSVGRRSCEQPRWKTAELTVTKNGARWLVQLGARLPAGHYRLLVRGLDKRGNASRLVSGKSTVVRVGRSGGPA
jgi:hypothetical protein